MFDTPNIKDARPIAWLKRGMTATIVALLVIGAVSSHRAYFQVRSLEVKTPSQLKDGSRVEVATVCSGRNMVDVVAMLVQGQYSEVLFNFRVPGNDLAFFDPRAQRLTYIATLNDQTLKNFEPGPARLRVVATGRPEWGRLPPPTVRELDVTIPSR
jgi:hypothetical protein